MSNSKHSALIIITIIITQKFLFCLGRQFLKVHGTPMTNNSNNRRNMSRQKKYVTADPACAERNQQKDKARQNRRRGTSRRDVPQRVIHSSPCSLRRPSPTAQRRHQGTTPLREPRHRAHLNVALWQLRDAGGRRQEAADQERGRWSTSRKMVRGGRIRSRPSVPAAATGSA